MPLRFVGIGDTHLYAGPRNVDRLAALDQIIDAGLALDGLSGWLYPGDLFDSRSTVENRNALDARLQRMADAAPVFIVAGNHDAAGDLDGFARLKAQCPIHVITEPRCVRATSLVAGVTIFGFPYPHKAAYVADGVAPTAVGAAADLEIDKVFAKASVELAAARALGYRVLMIGHGTIAGATTSIGQPLGIERDVVVTTAHLDRLGPIAKIWSHVHKPQTVHGAYYLGSIAPMDWGECEPKRYLVVDIAPDSSFTVTSRLIATPPMYHVEATMTAEAMFTYAVTRGPDGEIVPMLDDQEDWTGCDVRVRVRYPQQERARMSDCQTYIRKHFAAARRVEIEPIAVPDRALRAPEVVAATTLREKLEAWARVSDVAWSDEIQVAADRLQASDGDAVVADVERRLASIADLSGLLAVDEVWR